MKSDGRGGGHDRGAICPPRGLSSVRSAHARRGRLPVEIRVRSLTAPVQQRRHDAETVSRGIPERTDPERITLSPGIRRSEQLIRGSLQPATCRWRRSIGPASWSGATAGARTVGEFRGIEVRSRTGRTRWNSWLARRESHRERGVGVIDLRRRHPASHAAPAPTGATRAAE
jgi:hypothetical protein